MRIALPDDLNDLSTYIRPMLDLVGADRWFRRAEHFSSEVDRSRYRWKIVSDYHWLEMGSPSRRRFWRRKAGSAPNMPTPRSWRR
jgi:hypothetical protein